MDATVDPCDPCQNWVILVQEEDSKVGEMIYLMRRATLKQILTK